jgi:hypothetical protein
MTTAQSKEKRVQVSFRVPESSLKKIRIEAALDGMKNPSEWLENMATRELEQRDKKRAKNQVAQ